MTEQHDGLEADAAIRAIREVRSPRAIETVAQEEFVVRFTAPSPTAGNSVAAS